MIRRKGELYDIVLFRASQLYLLYMILSGWIAKFILFYSGHINSTSVNVNPYRESVDGLNNRRDFNLVRGIYRLVLRLPGELVHFRRCKSISHRKLQGNQITSSIHARSHATSRQHSDTIWT